MLKNEIAALTSFLCHHGWLRHTPLAFAEAFLAHCHWRQFGAGTGLQHAGQSGASTFGLARGTVSVTTSLAAPDTAMIHIGHPGGWFGFVPLFVSGGVPNAIVARTDVTIASITKPEIEALVSRHPEWWRHIGTLGIVYGNTAVSVAADLMLRDSSRRCTAALLQLANCRFEEAAGAQTVEAPLSQDELAAIANLSRTSVSTILHNLEKVGLIRLGYRSVVLLDPAALRARVDQV